MDAPRRRARRRDSHGAHGSRGGDVSSGRVSSSSSAPARSCSPLVRRRTRSARSPTSRAPRRSRTRTARASSSTRWRTRRTRSSTCARSTATSSRARSSSSTVRTWECCTGGTSCSRSSTLRSSRPRRRRCPIAGRPGHSTSKRSPARRRRSTFSRRFRRECERRRRLASRATRAQPTTRCTSAACRSSNGCGTGSRRFAACSSTDRRRASAPRAPTVAFTVKGVDSRVVATRLAAEQGVFAPNGNFYAATVAERMGISGSGWVRAGCACYTTADEVDRLVGGVRAISASAYGVAAGVVAGGVAGARARHLRRGLRPGDERLLPRDFLLLERGEERLVHRAGAPQHPSVVACVVHRALLLRAARPPRTWATSP